MQTEWPESPGCSCDRLRARQLRRIAKALATLSLVPCLAIFLIHCRGGPDLTHTSPRQHPQSPSAAPLDLELDPQRRAAARLPRVRRALPPDLVIEPGGEAELVLAGHELERIRRARLVTPVGRRATGLEAILAVPGERSSTQRWLEIRAAPTAEPGSYHLELDGEETGVFVASEILTIEVAPSAEPHEKRTP